MDFDQYIDSVINEVPEEAPEAKEEVEKEEEGFQDEPQHEENPENTVSDEDREPDSEDPAEPEIKKEDKPSGKRKIPIKVYGKEEELELDDDEIKKYVQKGHAVDLQFKKNAEERKELEALKAQIEETISYVKNNPIDFLEKTVGKEQAQKIYEDRVIESLAMQKMSPEQREAYQYEKQIEQRRQAAKEELEQIKAQESEERNRYYLTQLNEMTQDALKSVDLPISKASHTEFLAFATPYIRHNDDVTYEELEILADRFKEVKQENIRQSFEKLDGEGLYNLLGKQNAEKIRKFFLKQAQPVKEAPKPKTDFSSKKDPERWDPRKTRDYFDSL